MGGGQPSVEKLVVIQNIKANGNSAFWQDKPVLVTGGTGLVGSALVSTLLKLGADVVCLVRDWVPNSELIRKNILEKTRVVRGDICDQVLLERVLGDYEIETVFHLAAQTIVTVANRNPVETFRSNIAGTWGILEAARRSPTVKQIIVASSDKAYGDKEELPYTESMSLTGRHPYDVSKSCADLIAQSYAHSYNLPVVVTRCGNFFGGGDLNWNRIVPGTIRSILRGKAPIIRSNGQYIRDYIYVGDAVEAYILVAEKMMQNPELMGEAFNFSNENQVTVLGLVDKMIQLMGASIKPVIQNQVNNEIRNQYLSAEKARKLLGWSPLYSLDDGLIETIHWYQTFFEEVTC
jgi:CDP-glucose 4,6-dehydratase